MLDRYCVVCHNERLQRGALALDVVRTDEIGAHAELWEKVLQKLQTQSIAAPRPAHGLTRRITTASRPGWKTELDQAGDRRAEPWPTHHPPAQPPLSIRTPCVDLLGLDVDGETLLPGGRPWPSGLTTTPTS